MASLDSLTVWGMPSDLMKGPGLGPVGALQVSCVQRQVHIP